MHKKTTLPDQLRVRFAQAVAEIYTLRQAGLDLDMANSANRGVYKRPNWVKDIKLYRTDSGELALAFPQYKSAEHFIKIMQSTPSWEPAPAEDDELLVEEGAEAVAPEVPAAEPVMDPDTPAFKRAAIVKQDPDKKPFDFMSNRPVPRAKPVEAPVVEEAVVTVETSEQIPPAVVTVVGVKEASPAANAPRHDDIAERAQRLADEISAIQKTLRSNKTSSAPQVDSVKWRHAEIADDALKFAVSISSLMLLCLATS